MSRVNRVNAWIGDRVARRRLQPLWERALHLSLLGLNAGRGANVETSGERWVIDVLLPAMADVAGWQLELFDVGAHRGEWSLAVADRLGRRARLRSLEPSADTAQALRSAVAGRPEIEVLEIGLSDATGARQLYADTGTSALASVYDRRLGFRGIEMSAAGQAAFETLDGLCSRLRIEHVDLLKLDIEGHELSALAGAADLLADGRIDVVQFEFGGANIDSRTYLQDFWHVLHPAYRLFRIVLDGVWELRAYDERDELFVTTNFLAVRRDAPIAALRPDLLR